MEILDLHHIDRDIDAELENLRSYDYHVNRAFEQHHGDELNSLKLSVANLARQRDEYAVMLRKEWHAITEISPPVNRFIWVCAAFTNDYGNIRHRDHKTLKAYCDQHGDWRTSNGRLYADITHWMELPELPQEIITLSNAKSAAS